MDESSGEPGNRGIDARVGGLVWVRRRNGSWWPGRIMGMDELPESCLVSPRSGTPVKLLGRADASIDWYNLERSKRVKAFRCGEYDDCIEKAKAAANLNKKAVKYARREDAILHALELESSLLGKEQNGISVADSPSGSISGREADPITEYDTDSDNNLILVPELSRSGLSFEEPNPSTRRRTPNDSEDEGNKRTRGLEDLGLGIASNKDVLTRNSNNPMNGCKDHSFSLKRKRSQVPIVHDYLKRKDRRRPLSKVLENTTMVSVPNCSEQTASPKCVASHYELSGLEFDESKGNGLIVVDISNIDGSPTNNCDHTSRTNDVDHDLKTKESKCPSELPENEVFETFFEEPSVREIKSSADLPPMLLISSAETQVSGLNGQLIQINQADCAFLLSDGLTGSSPRSAIVHSNGTMPTAEKGTSEWLSKGKRNSRQLARKHSSLKNFDLKDESNIQSSLQYRKSRFNPHSPYKTAKYSVGSFTSDPSWHDVDLEVKAASHRPPHVPLVSLMSKLNGKAIIGHPLTVEALDDGKSDLMVSSLPSHVPVLGVSDAGYRNKAKKKQKGQHFSSRKSKKRRKSGGPLSKKMRKLSSLTGKKGRVKSGKLAADKNTGPVIACIPLKVVFSRINEAVNGSMRSMTSRV